MGERSMTRFAGILAGVAALLLAGSATAQSKLYDNWNRSGCGFTNTAYFRITGRISISKLEIWRNWRRGEKSVSYILSKNGRKLHRSTFRRQGCDTYQQSWCVGRSRLTGKLTAGNFSIYVPAGRLCQNRGSRRRGFLRVFGSRGGGGGRSASSGGNYSSIGGCRLKHRYLGLARRINVPQDRGRYGKCREWGYWSGRSYAGYSGLPSGYWIYAYPNWYIYNRRQ